MRETFSRRLENVPDLLSLVAAHPQQYPFLLDSAASGPLGRYSLLLRAGSEILSLDNQGVLTGPGRGRGFLNKLKSWYLSQQCDSLASGGLPFCGGWFLYLGYELAGEIESVLALPQAGDGLPIAMAVRCEAAIIIEHGDSDTAWLVAERQALLTQMQEELSTAPALAPQCPVSVDQVSADPDEAFITAVDKVRDYLAGGDVFQVNLSREWRGVFGQAPWDIDIYRRLRHSNPAPFAGLMKWRGKSLMSSSPERLVEVRERLVQTRPIAGTHPRGTDRESDEAMSRNMLAHPKERAEHIMLIDLERNDLGRVCETGSVDVSELMVVETYAHVHHIVSNVMGRLREDATPVDVIRAVFPGGTITGCPKVRCMQIIAELEKRGRGFYTGSMGYLSRDGQMDINILIRSMLLDGRHVSLRTGAGIVADSQAEQELAETRAKARGLLMALQDQSGETT